jgi:hypothetical protein
MISEVLQSSVFASTYNPGSAETPASAATTVLFSKSSSFSAQACLSEIGTVPGIPNTQAGSQAEAYILRYVTDKGGLTSVWLPSPPGGDSNVSGTDCIAVTFGVWVVPWVGEANGIGATALGTVFIES